MWAVAAAVTRGSGGSFRGGVNAAPGGGMSGHRGRPRHAAPDLATQPGARSLGRLARPGIPRMPLLEADKTCSAQPAAQPASDF